MGISYILHLATPTSADEVAGLVAELTETAGLVERARTAELRGEGTTLFSGLTVLVRPTAPHPRDPVSYAMHVPSTVDVHLDLDKAEDFGPQHDQLIWLSLAVLQRVTGDALLEFQMDDIWLLRRSGVLYLSADDEVWDRDQLARVGQPYERAVLAFPA